MIFGKHVNRYYIKYIVFYLIGIAAIITVDYIQLEVPGIFREVIDRLDSKVVDPNFLDFLWNIFTKLMAITATLFIGRIIWRLTLIGVGPRIEADLRDRMFRHSEHLSSSYFQVNKTGALMSLYTNDLAMIKNSFSWGVLMVFDILGLGVMAFVKMCQLDYRLALLSLLPVILISLVSRRVSREMTRRYQDCQNAFGDLSDFAQENISGIAILKAFVKEAKAMLMFESVSRKNVDRNVRFAKMAAVIQVLFSSIFSIVIIMIFGLGSYLIITTNHNFTIGNLQEFQLYFLSLIWPLMAIGQVIHFFSQGRASYNRIKTVLDAKIDIGDDLATVQREIVGEITFKDLSFRFFDGKEDVLKKLNFTIKANTICGIIGKTGSGKSTISDLLLRMYNLSADTLLIDGVDIMHYPLKQIRSAIGYVPQDSFLFSKTIKENIAFAKDHIDMEEVVKFARFADVHDNIDTFKEQYDTLLGERGVTISRGQKQRVSLARALMVEPKILILDDSFSAVDTKTEEKILNSIFQLREKKTTIMISHRVSTVMKADLIVVLDNGSVIGLGTHKELIKTNKYYADIVDSQELESIEVGGEDHE